MSAVQLPAASSSNAQTPAKCVEILKQCLAWLAPFQSQGIALTPMCYSVLFAHFSKTHPLLTRRLEELQAIKGGVSNAALTALYNEFLVVEEDPQANIPAIRFQVIMEQAQAAAQSTAAASEQYTKSIIELEGALDTFVPGAAPVLRDKLSHVTAGTKSIREASASLSDAALTAVREVEVLKAELQRARLEAITDPLSNLLNRRGFKTVVQDLADRMKSGVLRTAHLLTLDIDHFKKVNDTFGHGTGDVVLTEVADTLRALSSPGKSAFRLGGEEFAMLIEEGTREDALRFAQAVCARVGRSVAVRDADTGAMLSPVTVSVGLATWGVGAKFEAVEQAADKALYAAKAAGRNRVMAA